MFSYKSMEPACTTQLANKVAAVVKPGTVLCLDGDLGAGKTFFTQSFTRALGVTGEVTSPTFNLMNIYQGMVPIYHFDLYRLESEDELDEIGFYDYTDCPDGIVLIEWAAKFPECLPEDYISIQIERTDEENQRIFSFSLVGSALQDTFEEMKEICRF